MKTYHLSDFQRVESPVALQRQLWGPDYVNTRHRHDFIELIYVFAGGGMNLIDNFAFPILTGDIYVIGRRFTHSFRSEKKLGFFNLMFHPDLFTRSELKCFEEHPSFRKLFLPKNLMELRKIRLAPAEYAGFEAQFRDLENELEVRSPGRSLEVKAILIRLINSVCRRYESTVERNGGRGVGTAPIAGNDDPLIRLVEFLNTRFRSPLTLEDMAREARLSVTYVGEFFQERMGISPQRYLNSLRLECACRLLREKPELRMLRIARESGFSDPSYFARQFRQVTGQTPSSYRNALR